MILETHGLTKSYNSRIGCSQVTLSVRQGQIFGLLGPNGAGKSTFVKMLVGLLRPTAGEGTMMGYPLGHVEARKHIGYLPELFRYQDWLSAAEVLRLHARLAGMSVREARSAKTAGRIREALHEVGLDGRGRDRVRQFSKGMQQRLGLAAALLMDPSLVILDEPSSALDPVGRYEVRTLLEKLRSAGKTVFLNTHLLEDVEAVCDEVAFMYEGELKAVGPLGDIVGKDNWQLSVGGWDASVMEKFGAEPIPGVRLRTLSAAPDGSARLEASAGNRELIGLLNARLIEAGITLYEAHSASGSLEEWFLSMVERKRGDGV